MLEHQFNLEHSAHTFTCIFTHTFRFWILKGVREPRGYYTDVRRTCGSNSSQRHSYRASMAKL